MKPRVLIVGAGPTGLTAAVELARRGVLASVIEKHDAPSRFSRAVGILPASMAILTPSGVAAAIRRDAIAVQNAVIHHDAARVLTLRLDADPDPDMRMFALAQDRTEGFLRDAFERAGGAVRYETALDGFEQGPDGIATDVGGRHETYDYLIGADGVHSRVREVLDVAFDGEDLPDSWSIADVDANDWPYHRDMAVFLSDGGRAVIVIPLEKTRFRVISNTPDALASLPAPMTVTRRHNTGVFTIAVRQVARYAVGRVFLVGDAAHCHSPVGGRGMNLGIADAADLARRIVGGGLDGYHDARRAEGHKVLVLSERGRKLAMSANPVTRTAVFAGLRAVDAVPALNRRMARLMLTG